MGWCFAETLGKFSLGLKPASLVPSEYDGCVCTVEHVFFLLFVDIHTV